MVPGGNVTGLTLFAFAAAEKRTELLHELIPSSAMIALLLNPLSPIITENERRSVEITAAALGRKIQILYASSESEIEAAFATTARQGTGGFKSAAMHSSPTDATRSLVVAVWLAQWRQILQRFRLS
jgi:hypothetical protein